MTEAKKNTAYYLSFPAVDSTTPAAYKTGLSPVDDAYSKDGAGVWTALAITDTAAEIGSTGVYEIDLTAAEMNHDQVIVKFSVSGMADDAYQFDLRTKLVDDLNDFNSATDTVADVTLCATTTTLTNLPAITTGWLTATGIATDAIGAAELAADAITEIQAGLATPTNITAGTITTVSNATVVAATAAYFQDFFTVDSGEVSGSEVSGSAMLEIAKIVWDRVLNGANHNITASAGKRLRQVDAAFEVHSGTAQAGSTATTIILDTGADGTNNNIYRGDRCIIVAGTGIGEHDIVTSYVASTRVATMAETWIVTPDNTSEFILVPASVDVETWQHSVVTGDGDWAAQKAETVLIVADTNELQTDWKDAGRLDAILDARMAETSINTTAGAVDNVTLVATTTTNTDMVGTAGANTTVPDAAGTAATLHGTTDGLVNTANTNISAIQTVLTGITSLAEWLGIIAGKQVGDATAQAEMRTTGAGSGGVDPTTDSQEAIRDNQSAGAGDASEAKQDTILAKMLAYTRLVTRSDAGPTTDDATELTAINANDGGGAGAYVATTDSLQALQAEHDATQTTLAGIGGAVGPGSRALQYTANDTGSNPIPNVKTWVSTDSPYTTPNTVAGTLITDDNGIVDFLLDEDVVYYLWRDISTFNFTNPLQIKYSSANSRWEIWNGAAYIEWT